MAIQKHNIYYDASKPESGIYYYAENGEQKELFLNNVLSGENGISAISAIDGNTWVIGITDDYKDNIEKIPGLSDNFVILSADKLDTSAFTAYSAHALDDYYKKAETYNKQEIQNALDEKQDNLTNEQLSAISSVSAIQSISANWLTEEDIEDFITEDEVESVSSTLTAQTNYLSGIIDTKLDTTVFDTYTATALDDYYTKDETKGLINDLSSTVSSQLNNKLDTSIFTAYSGNINNQINAVFSEVDKKLYTSATNDWDVTPYSGINGIKVENHLISVSANYALSADVYSKSQIDDIIANFGGFQIVSEDAQGKPDVSDPSTKIIYLTLVDDDPAAFDKYREWIWTNSEWECIGIASIDLKDYAKTQDVIASANATSAWINNTFYDKTETSGKTEIQNALDTKLDTTAFNDYSDNIDEQLQTLSSVKLDTSAFTAYSDNIESQLDTLSAIKLDKTYSATVNEQLSAKLDTSAFTAYSAEINTELNNITADVDKKLYTSATDNWDYVAYSGGQNVSVVDHIIDISGTKSLSGDGKNIEVVELADTFIISATKDIVDKSYVDNNFVSKTDFGTYSGNAKNQIDSKLDISAFTAYSAHALDNYYTKDETSGKSEIQNALAEKQDNLTNEQLSAISSVSAIQSNTENWNAAYDTLTAYSADGKWLIANDITALATKNEVEIASGVLTAQTNYLSGIIDTKLDTATFTAYSAHALDNYYNIQETDNLIDDLSATVDNRLTNKLDTSAFTAYSADVKTQIDSKLNKSDFDNYSANALNDYYTKNETNAKITDAINDISATVSTDYLKKADVQEYTAGNNIDITNYVISGRDWTPELNTKVNNIDFTAYSASTKTQIDSKLNKSDFDNYSATALDDYYKMSETSGSQQIADALNTKLNKTDFDNYSAHALDDYYKMSETSGKTEIQNALDTKLNTSAFTAYSGNVDTLLNNISANTTALSANKLDISAFTAYSATAFNDYYTKSETDTKITDAINDISATVSTDYLKKADVREYTAGDNIDITNYVISGKDWTPELNTKVNNTDFSTYSASTKTQIDSKLNKDDFNTYSAHADTTPYSGINGIKVENHLISVSANYALSADVYSKSEVDDIRDNIAKELAGLGFYDCKSDEIKANGEPDETVLETRELLSNNKIYLVKDNTAPVPDQYKEWIWDGTNWTCIGDTSISLVAYAKTQDVIASAIATSAWINDTFYDKTETSGKQQIQDALNTKLNTNIFTAYSASTKTQIDSKLNKSDFDDYSATALVDYYKKSETSGKTEIQNALGTKLDTTAFNDYTATALNNYYTKDETSGKNEIQNALNTKLDTTAFNDYTATALNDIASNSGNWNASYTALTANSGNWDNTYNTVTTNSGKWENSYTALTANSALWLKEADIAGFATKTELNNASSILINQDNYLSGVIDTKLDTTAFNAYSAHALDEYYKKSETSGKTEIQNALGTKLDTTAFNNYSANVKTQIDSKLTKNDFDSYSAAVDNDIDYISAAVSSIPAQVQSDWDETNTASPAYIQNKPADLEMSAGNGISITETNNTLVFAVSGNYADATEVNNKLTALSANKFDISATTGWDISAYSAGNNITIVDHVIDLKESKNLIGDGENIIVTESGNNIIVSALKDILDKDDFDSYSAIIDDDIDYLSAAIEDSILSVGTDLKIENGIISVNTNGTANSADMSFVAGSATYVSGIGAAAFGYASSAVDNFAFAEGIGAKAIGVGSHAEGVGTNAIGKYSHTEGNYTTAAGSNSHAEGQQTLASGYVSHSEGYQTTASGYASHTEGFKTNALNYASHAEGGFTVALGDASHAEGNYTQALGIYSHSEGYQTTASGQQSHAEGAYTLAQKNYTHTEGYNTSAIGYTAHAEGDSTFASGNASHTEGQETSANYGMAHAEGVKTLASGYASHTEGSGTRTNDSFAHAEGYGTSSISAAAHAEGWQTSAAGIASHAEGQNTIANSYAMHAGGMYNKTSADALFVIGNGSADDARSDAFIITSGGLASAVTLATSGISDVESAIGSLSSNLDSYVKYTDLQYAIGSANTATGSTTSRYSVALGTRNSAYNSFVIGNYNKGKESHIFGDSNSGINSYIVGYNCTGNESYLFGKDLSGKSWGIELGDFGDTCYPVIVGNKNETNTSAYFVVGCGNTLGNADAFIVSSNKVASAADFRAGNGVSLSSLTGLTQLSAGTDLKIENGIISVNTNGTANSAYMAFVEGSATLASGQYSHAEGVKTFTSGGGNHAEGYGSSAISWDAHAEGNYTLASGVNSHAEGMYTTAAGTNSHAEGYQTFAGYQAHSEGDSTSALGQHSHAEGQSTITNNNCAHAEGQNTSAMSLNSHAEGGWTIANNNGSHAEGQYTSALGYASHAEGYNTSATAAMGHAEGNFTSAVGQMSHAEGSQVLAQGDQSHAEGNMTTAFGGTSHAEGVATLASGRTSHAEGAETSALEYASHAEGYCTIAASTYMHAGGEYNKTSADALFVIGNGSAESARSDAFIITSAGLASAVTLATSGIPDIEAAITSIPAQVQSDWEETVTSNPSYIQNKPDVLIPVDSPAALGGISKPTNIMVVSALPASPDSATIYLVQGTMIGN